MLYYILKLQSLNNVAKTAAAKKTIKLLAYFRTNAVIEPQKKNDIYKSG